MNNLIILFIGIVGLSFFFTYIYRYYALKFKILDIPNKRSSHSSPVTRGGGLAIVICWYIGLTYVFLNNLIDKNLFLALLSGVILAFISLIDDIISIKPLIRLSVQFITALLAVYFLKGLKFVDISGWIISNDFILIPLIIVSIVWFINLYNFLDGIDGYASIEAISVSLILYIFTGKIICLILLGCVSGFLFWNWPKARIFMGDVGSTQLGYILIVLGLYLNNETQFNIIYWFILTSAFWFDATLTLIRRWLNKEKLSHAHKKHIYQRIVQSGFSHLQTDLILIIINISLAGIILVIRQFTWLTLPSLIFVILAFTLLTHIVDNKVPFK